jgi:hypothetical protein
MSFKENFPTDGLSPVDSMTMHPLTALCFPESIPDPRSSPALLFFFDSLCYFRANESPPPAPRLDRKTPSPFVYLCPFKEDADSERFRQLVKDLNGRGREFYLHSLASFTRQTGSTEESSVFSLFTLLTGRTEEIHSADQTLREKRWQARLLLQLSAMLAEEEQEIAGAFAKISRQRAKMLAALQGDDEDNRLYAAPPLAGSQHILDAFSQVQLSALLEAWFFFYAAAPETQGALLCASLPTVAEILIEAYEKKTRQPPIELLRLPLHFSGDLEQAPFDEQRAAFLEKSRELRLTMAELLKQSRTAKDPAALCSSFAGAASAFEQLQPKSSEGECRDLVFYCLPGMPAASLGSHLFPKLPPHSPAIPADGSNELLAVLS